MERSQYYAKQINNFNSNPEATFHNLLTTFDTRQVARYQDMCSNAYTGT